MTLGCHGRWVLPAVIAAGLGFAGEATAATLGGRMFAWPSGTELWRVLSFQDYNTRVVIIGTSLLGLAAGLIGTFLLLRKRALLSDTLSHATLPGIALAFILMASTLGEGKLLPGLIAGAAVFAVIGTASVLFIQKHSRLKEDAALGIVLSVYFGLGIALLGMATRMESVNAAGLTSFIYGKTASMLFYDAVRIAATAVVAALCCVLFFKEFALICFDGDFGNTQGWPVGRLDFFMMCIVVAVTVIGLQAVGLILVVALLIIPASAARFWTDRLHGMLWLSGAFGAISGFVGAGISALMANLPAGAVIVVTASVVFMFSMVFGSTRGLLRMLIGRRHLKRKIATENLLRDLYEWFETGAVSPPGDGEVAGPTPTDLLGRRSWAPRVLHRTIGRLSAAGLLSHTPDGRMGLTPMGADTARGVVRKHRLWEAYLIAHADVAPGMVDLSADRIEHVLDSDIIAGLEAAMAGNQPAALPRSPHRLAPAAGQA